MQDRGRRRNPDPFLAALMEPVARRLRKRTAEAIRDRNQTGVRFGSSGPDRTYGAFGSGCQGDFEDFPTFPGEGDSTSRLVQEPLPRKSLLVPRGLVLAYVHHRSAGRTGPVPEGLGRRRFLGTRSVLRVVEAL